MQGPWFAIALYKCSVDCWMGFVVHEPDVLGRGEAYLSGVCDALGHEFVVGSVHVLGDSMEE